MSFFGMRIARAPIMTEPVQCLSVLQGAVLALQRETTINKEEECHIGKVV